MSTPAHDHIEPLPETIKYEEYPSHPGYGHISPLWDSSCSLYPERELKRIADCWNACAGIDDPAKEIPQLRADISMLNQRLAERTQDMLAKFAVIEAELRKRAADAEKRMNETLDIALSALSYIAKESQAEWDMRDEARQAIAALAAHEALKAGV